MTKKLSAILYILWFIFFHNVIVILSINANLNQLDFKFKKNLIKSCEVFCAVKYESKEEMLCSFESSKTFIYIFSFTEMKKKKKTNF